MKWNQLNDIDQFENILSASKEKPVLIFKHSINCSISAMALSRLERSWKEEDNQIIEPYYLDLISYRNISNAVAEHLNITHQSPQVIVLKNGEAVYHTSHMGINYGEILRTAQN